MAQSGFPFTAPPAKGNFRSLPTIKIDGEDAPKGLMEDIIQISVEESLHLPGMFTMVIQNDYFSGKGEKPWRHQDVIQIGKSIVIGFIASSTDAKEFSQENQGEIIEAEITAIETHFTEKSQAPIIVRGYDTMHRLHRGQYNRSFQNLTDSDIVKRIMEETGLKEGKIDPSGEPHEYLFQENQTNMQFLRDRANRIGFELFVQNGKLYFRKPKVDQVLKLKWLKDISSFRVRVTSAEQVQEVEVRAWNYAEKKAIVSTQKTAQLHTETDYGKGSEVSNPFKGKPPTPRRIVVDRPVFNPKEADAIAQAVCNEIAGQYVHADAKAEGNPKLRPGKVIELENMGKYSGKYYITETRHLYYERVYLTEFSIRGLRGGEMLTLLAQPPLLKAGQTMLVGIVTDNKDPEKLGRVKVKFPTLTEEHSSHWARVVSMGAGENRGFDCLPEINDEVLVAFEHGDIHRPYIIGGVWNGKDKPPTSVDDSVKDGKVRLRTIQTRTGHQIQFVEEDGASNQVGVYIKTKGGQELFMNDSDHSITLNSTKNLTIKATGNIDISAGGVITIKGSLIKLN
jgi:phage protein D/phage baseplate assembly protein gpV